MDSSFTLPASAVRIRRRKFMAKGFYVLRVSLAEIRGKRQHAILSQPPLSGPTTSEKRSNLSFGCLKSAISLWENVVRSFPKAGGVFAVGKRCVQRKLRASSGQVPGEKAWKVDNLESLAASESRRQRKVRKRIEPQSGQKTKQFKPGFSW